MSWFAAHIILRVELRRQPQSRFPLWENIVLLQADTEEEAWAKAEQRGREDEGDEDGGFRWGGQPARWVFAGVRKLTLCQDGDKRPRDGTEVSFNELEVSSEEAIAKLLAGQPVSVKLADKYGAVTHKS